MRKEKIPSHAVFLSPPPDEFLPPQVFCDSSEWRDEEISEGSGGSQLRIRGEKCEKRNWKTGNPSAPRL